MKKIKLVMDLTEKERILFNQTLEAYLSLFSAHGNGLLLDTLDLYTEEYNENLEKKHKLIIGILDKIEKRTLLLEGKKCDKELTIQEVLFILHALMFFRDKLLSQFTSDYSLSNTASKTLEKELNCLTRLNVKINNSLIFP